MTLTEYTNYDPPLGYRDELLEGELVLSPSANAHHAELCHRLSAALERSVVGPFVVRLDTTMELDEDEERGNRPRPDVFVIGRDRWNDAVSKNSYPQGSPELAIEVLSPTTGKVDREVKAPRYLQAGSLAVWLVDGDAKSITVVTKEGSVESRLGSEVTLPAVIGAARIGLSQVFDWLLFKAGRGNSCARAAMGMQNSLAISMSSLSD